MAANPSTEKTKTTDGQVSRGTTYDSETSTRTARLQRQGVSNALVEIMNVWASTVALLGQLSSWRNLLAAAESLRCRKSYSLLNIERLRAVFSLN